MSASGEEWQEENLSEKDNAVPAKDLTRKLDNANICFIEQDSIKRGKQMRQKKNPEIRQEAFIRAATELFMEKGVEKVSVRDVLDAVADKTASPSVFYYYFPSKDALYRACVNDVAQNYLDAIRKSFSAEKTSPEEWMLSLVACMEAYLLNERNLMLTGSSTPNRLFVLEMREQVTKQIGVLWAETLPKLFRVSPEEAKNLAVFLTGGISELLFSYMLESGEKRTSVRMLSESVVQLCMKTLGLREEQKAHMLSALRQRHKENI